MYLAFRSLVLCFSRVSASLWRWCLEWWDIRCSRNWWMWGFQFCNIPTTSGIQVKMTLRWDQLWRNSCKCDCWLSSTRSCESFCLNYGCQHEQGERYLSSCLLDSSPALGHCTSCPVCNPTYHKDFLPVYRSGVESFLEWLTATAKLPFTVDFKVQLS